MDRFDKFLAKLPAKEKETLISLFKQIHSRQWENLDIKKLSGHHDLFRVRKGDVRIIFLDSRHGVEMISIGRRNDTTYS